jgi:tetratricopeptide (TPR) repeat protein
MERARDLFGEVAASTAADDPLHALSRLFAARVVEFYLPEPDTTAALDEYLALARLSTGNPVAEMAAARAVMLTAFADKPREERLNDLIALEELADHLTTPAGRRAFHSTLAFTLLELKGDQDRATTHFLEADKVGFTSKAIAVKVWLVAADAAARAGRREDALHFYRKMLAEYPRDPRAFLVRERMRQLEGPNG